MKSNTNDFVLVVDDQTNYTLIEVCQRLNIPEALLHEMSEHGLFEIHASKIEHAALSRIQAACRLHQDLDVNLPGVILALELHDQLEELKLRLAVLEKYLGEDI